jgi:hypothetical protein
MEHKKSGMIDNRKVKDSHQEGIERVKQRKGEFPAGNGHCSGKMSSTKGTSEANWKRSGGSMTPKSA